MIFRNSFRNIQNIKNGLRPLIENFRGKISIKKCAAHKNAAPLIRPKLCFVHLPPRGKAISKAEINFWTIVSQSVTRRAMPAPEGEGYEIGRQISDRKQAAPLDLQKFLPKYSENQKWAAHNMLRPSSPRFAQSFPPEGKPWNKASHFFEFLR